MDGSDRFGTYLFGDEAQPQQFGDAVRAGAAQDVRAVDLDRPRAERKPPRERRVSHARGEAVQYVAFARRERGEALFGLAAECGPRPRRAPVVERIVQHTADGLRVERRGEQIAGAAAQYRPRFRDVEPLRRDEDAQVGACGDAGEQRRAVDASGLMPVEQQDAARGVACGLQPGIGARKASHDAAGPREQAETGRPLGRIGQDEMDMACNIAHPVVVPAPSGRHQCLWLGDDADPDRSEMHRCAQPPCSAMARRGGWPMPRPCSIAPLALASLLLVAVPGTAKEPPRYSEEQILDATTVVIASQQLCGYRVDEKAIRALLAAKLPDLTDGLIALQLRGYARVLPTLDDEKRQRHCAETRDLARAAGWLL